MYWMVANTVTLWECVSPRRQLSGQVHEGGYINQVGLIGFIYPPSVWAAPRPWAGSWEWIKGESELSASIHHSVGSRHKPLPPCLLCHNGLAPSDSKMRQTLFLMPWFVSDIWSQQSERWRRCAVTNKQIQLSEPGAPCLSCCFSQIGWAAEDSSSHLADGNLNNACV